ncbi:hypothetical protein DQ384_31875 [Sphaerisporangium album]|uniref:Bifunctional folylpolyglutamate synthase/dihydrofolate synthase n=1 Tax=Sphaerisporangium album TaxID=509200 RepID=A0A367F529_9ACTN|nr:hypothetical protein [Sphaerisporangium album]RCG24962.1 hypothetical protein DQ384_31875 [Sphaerisporangium album]
MSSDDVFFAEWRSRGREERRSLPRARHLLDLLDCPEAGAPVLTVVGSKGKGTAATYASAYFAASGLKVVSVTSPALRANRERIRVDGAAVSDAKLRGIAAQISKGLRRMPDRETIPGYLSPAGLFTIAGVMHAREVGADVIVLEAGMGGGSDEVSLFPAHTVAMTEIFAEHLGVLGDTPAEIAREKAAVTSKRTRAVLSLPQQPSVQDAINAVVHARAHLKVETLATGPGTRPPTVSSTLDTGSGTLLPIDPPTVATWSATAPPPSILPPSYGRWNAELGCAAAARTLSLLGKDQPGPQRLHDVLASVRLPGRLSFHTLPESGTELCVDSAINRAGVATALAMVRERWPDIDHVLLCLPDHKDVQGVVTELDGLPVTFVRLALPHLRFNSPLPAGWTVIDEEALTRPLLTEAGQHILALGTVYFTGKVLNAINAPTEQLFTP